MKTTLEIPDELYRAIKVKAAAEGLRVSELVEAGLRYIVENPSALIPAQALRKTEFPIIRSKTRVTLLTAEDVEQALTEIDKDEAHHHAKFMRR